MVCLLKGSEVTNHHNILVVLLKRLSFTQDTLEPGVRRRLCAPVTLYSELVNTLFGVYNTLDKLFNHNLQWTEIPFYKFLCYEVKQN